MFRSIFFLINVYASASNTHSRQVKKKKICKIHMKRPMEFKSCGKRLTDADLKNTLYIQP